ncbi:MAG: hypothetical protein JNL06_09775 [Alphaproteobacteria bacterium]|nr:hypothetical protein [Alphaproteobacteria bacterium]
MLREAVEVTILNRLEPKAVAAVKEFLTVNGDAKQIASLTNEKVATLYKAGQVALRLPVGTQIKGMQKFLEAQQSILAYAKNPLQSAIERQRTRQRQPERRRRRSSRRLPRLAPRRAANRRDSIQDPPRRRARRGNAVGGPGGRIERRAGRGIWHQ